MDRKWIIIAVFAAIAVIVILILLNPGISPFSSVPSKASPPPLPV